MSKQTWKRPSILVAASLVVLSASVAVYFNGMGNTGVTAARAANAAFSGAGKRALVVGGTSGIGQGIALRLAEAQFAVTIVGRNAERGEEIVKAMKLKSPESDHRFLPCDAMLVKNAAKCADDFLASLPDGKLDTLVVTPGIGTFSGHTPTSEGIEQKLAIHYYSRMAFVKHLLPALRKADAPSVLTVLSAGIHSPYSKYEADPDLTKGGFSLKSAADAAGFYNDIAMDQFSRDPLNSKVKFVHAAPGFVNTNWGSELHWSVKWLIRAVQPLGRSMEDCAEVMCRPVFDHRGDKGGFLLMGANGETVNTTKLHEQAREKVWEHTVEVLNRLA